MNIVINRLREKESLIHNLLSSRSILYNLEPVGLGTPYVESLTSYISRLALKHNVTVSSLVKMLFAQTTDKHYLKSNLSNGVFGDTAKYINGNSRLSLEYVNVLEQLTLRNDLLQLTMNSWTDIFTKNVVGEYRKWCPCCFNEWERENKDIYEPLLWYISDVNKCDVHGVELQEFCPNCNKKLLHINSHFNVGHCQYCFTNLGDKFDGKIIEYITEEEIFIINNYKELIENASSITFLPTKKSVSLSLNNIMSGLKINSTNFAKLIGVSPSTLSCWLSNRHIPSPESLIAIGRKIKSTIYNMLYGNVIIEEIGVNSNITKTNCKDQYSSKYETEYHLKNELYTDIPKSLKEIAKEKGFSPNSAKDQFPDLCKQISERYNNYKKDCWDEFLTEMKENLLSELSEEIPLSLSEIINKHGYSLSTVKRYFPILCGKITRRYKKYKEQLKVERIIRIKEEIKNVIIELHQRGESPYRKLVQKHLSQPAIFRNPIYRDYWEEIVLQLGYKL